MLGWCYDSGLLVLHVRFTLNQVKPLPMLLVVSTASPPDYLSLSSLASGCGLIYPLAYLNEKVWLMGLGHTLNPAPHHYPTPLHSAMPT